VVLQDTPIQKRKQKPAAVRGNTDLEEILFADER